MTELSLNVLDIAQNSIKAKATLIEISVDIDEAKDKLEIVIKDNGCGMSAETLSRVIDPFYTTRDTRKVGLGIPFFKMAAELTGGSFEINSKLNVGTSVKAVFVLSNIDRMPLGDMTETIRTLITYNINIDFIYTFSVSGKEFILKTSEMKEILEGVPLNNPEVSAYIKDFLNENTLAITENKIY